MNCHNKHEWAHENPHAIHRGRYQVRFKINVWTGIVEGCVLGPVVLPDRLKVK